jgi:hypothetical protein|tara:strand:- start:1137 stop:1448 length:312 start_codon:yes stop_codon:yes gene_type:complete
MLIKKVFGIDFDSEYGALTLPTSAVAEAEEFSGYHQRTHSDGWTITGYIQEDYYVWVNAFEATHELYGRVFGNFENTVFADSEEGYTHFYKNHTPEAWDYGDI